MQTASFVETVRSALIAEVQELRDDVRKLADGLADQELWKRPVEPGNSVGHLILHLTGNLKHYVGAQLGQTGYVRERDREFTETKAPSRGQLLQELDVAVATFARVVSGLTEGQLSAIHPNEKFGSVLKALVHLVAHFALHRGQISYIARLVGGSKATS